jgi:hypothetical protein
MPASESQGLVGGDAAHVHRTQDGEAHVGVVVDADVRLVLVGAHQPPRVLDEAPLEGDGEGEEEGVELGAVEALAEVLAGGHDVRGGRSWTPGG